jgi:hypothetical protein
MWIRKSSEEIQLYLNKKMLDRYKLGQPIIFAFVLSCVCLLIYSIGYRGGFVRGGIVLISSAPNMFNVRGLFIGLFLFVLFSIITIARQRKYGSVWGPPSGALLCRECKRPSNPNVMCSCGGVLEPFEYYNWMEDNES